MQDRRGSMVQRPASLHACAPHVRAAAVAGGACCSAHEKRRTCSDVGGVGLVQVDIWSLGVLACELLTTERPFSGPFSGPYMKAALEMIMHNHVVFLSFVSPLAKDLMSRRLQSDPSRRPTVDELQAHTWLARSYDGDM